MNNKNNQQILIGGAILYREGKSGRRQFLIVKNKEEDDWEIPKVTVRKGESSVRAVIRMAGEQAGITARVLEEAGRLSATVVINNKPVAQKHFYYLMMQRSSNGEIIGFSDYQWLDYAQIGKKLILKKEKEIFKNTKAVLKEWDKTKKDKIDQEEEDLLLQEQEEARLAI